METTKILLDLPLATLAPLGAGYIAYRIAYFGKDAAHKTSDIVLISLVFAALAKLIAACRPELSIIGNLLGGAVSIYAAALWRNRLEASWLGFLADAKVSYSDGHATAWDSIRLDERLAPTRITVRRKDGMMFMCGRLADFKAVPTGPLIYGSDGSLAMYVTHSSAPGDAEWMPVNPRAEGDFGAEITYFPASEIAAIYVCH